MSAQPITDTNKTRSQSRKLPLMTGFRLTEAELTQLRERAARENVSLASYLRQRAFAS